MEAKKIDDSVSSSSNQESSLEDYFIKEILHNQNEQQLFSENQNNKDLIDDMDNSLIKLRLWREQRENDQLKLDEDEQEDDAKDTRQFKHEANEDDSQDININTTHRKADAKTVSFFSF